MQETQTCVLEANLIRLGVYTKFVQVLKLSLFIEYCSPISVAH